MEWHDTKKLLIEKSLKNLELKQLTNKIKFGINKLNEYLKYMEKALNHVNAKSGKRDMAKANAFAKCQELRDIIDKKEKESNPETRGNKQNLADMQLEIMNESSLQKTHKVNEDKTTREEDKVLKEWAEALEEMVK